MTPEQQRIAIAETCGRQIYYWRATWNRMGHPKYMDRLMTKVDAEVFLSRNQGKIEEYLDISIVPDYLNDLNAMHAAEFGCFNDGSAWSRYYMHLGEVCNSQIENEGNSPISASASQRAEAFLRAIGKWEGGDRE